MSRPGFLHGVLVAACLAFFASAVFAALLPFVGFNAVVRLVIPAVSFAYLLYLLNRSDETLGRITTLSLWLVLAVSSWWIAPPLVLYLLLHVAAIWLVRSLYFYSGMLPAVMDLALSAFSVSSMVWAVSRSGSVFLATWCFFLVQALFVAIPYRLRGRHADPAVTADRFSKSRRQADDALKQLYSR